MADCLKTWIIEVIKKKQWEAYYLNAQATQVTKIDSKDKTATKQRNWKKWGMSEIGEIFHKEEAEIKKSSFRKAEE